MKDPDDPFEVPPEDLIAAHGKASAKWRDNYVSRDPKVDPEQLLANPMNPRIHPSRQQKAMYEVLVQLGWVGAVKVNINTGRVIDGHMRIALAITHEQTVPVEYYDLTEKEEARALAVFDAISRQAIYDMDLYTDVAGAWDDPTEGIGKLLDEMMPKQPLLDTPSESIEADDVAPDMSDVTYGMVGWGETKVKCTGDEIGDITRLHMAYRAENDGNDNGFLAWLIRSPHG